jgi:Flp pilus assembly protein TadG
MMHDWVRRAREDEWSKERGFFMVWFALTFVALMGFGALALEYSRWGSITNRVQKAADAAALAGAVFMPENVGNKAFDTAIKTAEKNGFKNGTNGIVVAPSVGSLSNQLKVTITVPTSNPFGAIVGYNSSTIVRSAVGEYQLPQNLGSPQNSYGNDPESAAAQPQFWGNVFGPASPKGNGDAVQSVGATANSTLCPTSTDNCTSNVNQDYGSAGYFYGIDVPAGASGSLDVQVFDPAFVMVGDNCTDAAAVNSLNAAATLTAAQIPGYTGTITPAQRYASGAASPFCSGDMHYNNTSTNLNPWTTWTLRGPDTTTWDPTNNPVVCQAEFPGVYPERANDLPNGTVDSQHLKALLQSATNYPGTNPARTFASFFRQWVTICSVGSPIQGTYFLQVQTATKINGTATPNGGGANRYSVRAGVSGNYATSNNLKLYGTQRMGIYANATGADTRFYLTRVPPGHAGHRLILQFFDTGDASQAGNISVLPPPDSNVAGGVFPDCDYTPPPGNSTPPWGTFQATSAGCTISNVSSANYNGQWVTLQVQIPDNYDCNETDPLGCWTRLRFNYPVGTTVNDTTTWAAYILGDPVRLVE